MLFPTHLVAAWALDRATRPWPRWLLGRATHPSPAWVVVGAALPDVVDKPLGMAGVTDLYHSVGHSLLFALVLVPVAVAVSGGAGRAVLVGWASHLVLDALHVVINGRPTDALFVAWPVLTPPAPPKIPPGSFFFWYLGSPSFVLECLFYLGLAAVLVRSWADGTNSR